MSAEISPEHVHLPECAAKKVDDLFRGDCDCGADDHCGDGDCDQCYPAYEDEP